MVGANAGGGTDIVARMLADKIGEVACKGTFVVENKPGASNTIAADLTAKAPPDGHTHPGRAPTPARPSRRIFSSSASTAIKDPDPRSASW